MADEDDTPQEHTHSLGVGIQAFKDSGLLWALNTNVLHALGYEVRVDGDQVVLAGYGAEMIHWPAGQHEAVEQVRIKYRQSLLDAQKFNNPRYHDGHSPGFNQRAVNPIDKAKAGR